MDPVLRCSWCQRPIVVSGPDKQSMLAFNGLHFHAGDRRCFISWQQHKGHNLDHMAREREEGE